MSPASKRLPHYLKRYAAVQDYAKYTPQDQAAWRFIMRQNRAFFSHHAVPVYVEGLKKTGIPLDRIPRISEMDECLSQFGWGAVAVVGFIPPSAFLEFQALGILPIACDMRTVNHLAYTPAPDIVHEAAGHAPIIADQAYAAYLHQYAKVAQRAIQSMEDIRVYEAIRYLSDIKENPDTPPGEVERADARLKAVTAAVTHTSEGTKVARMAWWTVEYGLVGNIKNPLIYGAGLLSSVGESQHCLSEKVKKLPLSLACTETSYDITEPQPQLFVAKDLDHLVSVLGELESNLAFRLGGVEGLRRAQQAGTMNSVQLDSGLEVSGVVHEYLADGDAPVFFKLSGPVHFAVDGEAVEGHDRARHPDGFSSPIGRWEGSPDPTKLSDSELATQGLKVGQTGRVKFVSGFVVEGRLLKVLRRDGRLLCLTFGDATVSRQGKTFYRPEWGEFDLTVGTTIPSVFGGPADRSVYADLEIGSATTNPSRTTPFSAHEKNIHDLYRRLRTFRETGAPDPSAALAELAADATDRFTDEWLVGIEVLEMIRQRLKSTAGLPWVKRLEDSLKARASASDTATGELIEKGLSLVAISD